MNITKKEERALVQEVENMCIRLTGLGCESARIVATASSGDLTTGISSGAGNFLCQYGSVKKWIIKIEESWKSQEYINEEDE